MRVVAKPALLAFAARYPEAEGALRAWYRTLEHAQPRHLDDLKATFNSVDYVPDRRDTVGWHVFNAGGNKWRVVCKLDFARGFVLIKHVFTHAEYDRWTDGIR